MRTLFFSAFLVSSLFCKFSFASEEFNPDRDARAMVHIRFEKSKELDKFIQEYRENEKPISLAVACGSWEMPQKITESFKSTVPAIENWIGLDLLSTDKNSCGGPHIRMDAYNPQHWQELADYLKQNGIQVQTVAMTICAPKISSPIIQETIWPLMKAGGQIVYPECFYTAAFGAFDVEPYLGLRSPKYGKAFAQDLKSYHTPTHPVYQNKELLLQQTMSWIGEEGKIIATMGWGLHGAVIPVEAEKKLEARFYVNRIASFNPEHLKNGVLKREMQYLYSHELHTLFTKTDQQFAQEFFADFKDYMIELGFEPSSFKIVSSNGTLEGVEAYTYPADGTFKLTGYQGGPSLVVIKK